MARATERTWLPLDRWFEIMGFNPLSANQLFLTNLSPIGSCGDVWFQHAYQDPQQASREDVANAIRQAEGIIATYVGYNLAPDWIADERHTLSRPARPELYGRWQGNVRGQLKSVRTNWFHVISGGIRATALIEAGVTADGVALSDLDGDGYEETVTLTVTVASGTSACQVRVFLPVSNNMVLSGGDEQWEVRPVNVSVSGTTATITFKRWQIVNPTLEEKFGAEALDGSLDASYVSTVDVYRVYNDPQTQASMLWEPDAGIFNCPSCNGTGCEGCAFSAQTACMLVRNERLGYFAFRPATWDSDTEQFDNANPTVCRDPEEIRLWYYSGWRPDVRDVACDTQLDPYWEKAIAYFAAGLLDRKVCDCNNVSTFIDHWQMDLSLTTGGTEARLFQVTEQDLSNPFGTTRGAMYAWRRASADGRRVAR